MATRNEIRLGRWSVVHPRTALTVSRIGGGSAVNAIPANAAIELDVRSTTAHELERLDAEIKNHPATV